VPRVLLFDIDLTMVRTAGAGRSAMDVAFAELFGVEKATEGIQFDGRTDRGIFFECLERFGLGGEALLPNFQRACEGYLQALPGWISQKGGIVLPGVRELLAELTAENAALGLATGNLRRGAAQKLGHFGLWDAFAGGGFGDDYTVRAGLVRAGIEEMAAKLGVAPEACDVIVVGDTPLDIEAAHGGGARAMGVGTGRFTPEELKEAGAEFAVTDLSETASVMEMLLG
jgi:phosphoglycolate phosphatase-like HAD superfamily hydrolase